MSANPRDTQFRGFAKLVLEEALTKGDVFVDTINDSWREDMQEVIARRAYDLAVHIASHVTEGDIASMDAGMSTMEQCINAIPDLTQWSEEDA